MVSVLPRAAELRMGWVLARQQRYLLLGPPRIADVPFGSANVLESEGLRQGIKDYR
jgi:hypothetical protein